MTSQAFGRKCLWWLATVVAAAGCASAPEEGTFLVPPAGTARDQVSFHMSQCFAEASIGLSGPLKDEEVALLKGRSTVKFVVRRKPVVSAYDGVPTMYSGSLSTGQRDYGPSALSDPYVICLLRRGYTWPEPRPGK